MGSPLLEAPSLTQAAHVRARTLLMRPAHSPARRASAGSKTLAAERAAARHLDIAAMLEAERDHVVLMDRAGGWPLGAAGPPAGPTRHSFA
jgi:hypothetical protein